MQSVRLNIEGMTCGGCVKSVTSILEGVAGVSRVEVSLEQHRALVVFDAAETTVAALLDAVEAGGFEASL
ncbi:MAG: heavy-metal-associated domain-containing protein [Cardiobacteriaceae bacterium]|nr:heavy-metal-associated domain-containing protein [Cardiobacteriaceae bacterium]